MLIKDFFENVYRVRRLRGKSPNTVRLYRLSIHSFGKTLGRPSLMADLTNDNVALHMQTVIDRGRAKATANKDRQQLLTIWRYATQQGYHTTWPDVMAEIEPVREPQAWLAEDIVRLFDTVSAMRGSIGGIPCRVWWRAILLVCLDTGERIGAVRQSQWSWLEHNWILFPAEVRKGGKRDKRYLLGEYTADALSELRACYFGENMFEWPYCDAYLWPKMRDILKAAGLPHGRRDKFHRLRRTCASVLDAAGMDASRALDHTHRKTTRAYIDPRFTSQHQASTAVGAWLAPMLDADGESEATPS